MANSRYTDVFTGFKNNLFQMQQNQRGAGPAQVIVYFNYREIQGFFTENTKEKRATAYVVFPLYDRCPHLKTRV